MQEQVLTLENEKVDDEPLILRKFMKKKIFKSIFGK